MTTPLIEAIARAICANTGGFAWECAPDDTKDGCLGDAQAALTAITEAGYAIVPREPTEAMLDVGAEAVHLMHDNTSETIASDCYCMISAAQGDG